MVIMKLTKGCVVLCCVVLVKDCRHETDFIFELCALNLFRVNMYIYMYIYFSLLSVLKCNFSVIFANPGCMRSHDESEDCYKHKTDFISDIFAFNLI